MLNERERVEDGKEVTFRLVSRCAGTYSEAQLEGRDINVIIPAANPGDVLITKVNYAKNQMEIFFIKNNCAKNSTSWTANAN